MPKYTFLAMAEEVLLSQSKPMSAQEIWEVAVAKSFDNKLGSKGQTPWNALKARLLLDVRDNPDSLFIRKSIKPARYVLKDKVASQKSIAELNTATGNKSSRK